MRGLLEWEGVVCLGWVCGGWREDVVMWLRRFFYGWVRSFEILCGVGFWGRCCFLDLVLCCVFRFYME